MGNGLLIHYYIVIVFRELNMIKFIARLSFTLIYQFQTTNLSL
jgi:hypothetical protein